VFSVSTVNMFFFSLCRECWELDHVRNRQTESETCSESTTRSGDSIPQWFVPDQLTGMLGLAVCGCESANTWMRVIEIGSVCVCVSRGVLGAGDEVQAKGPGN
jgi:hypothetical protein